MVPPKPLTPSSWQRDTSAMYPIGSRYVIKTTKKNNDNNKQKQTTTSTVTVQYQALSINQLLLASYYNSSCPPLSNLLSNPATRNSFIVEKNSLATIMFLVFFFFRTQTCLEAMVCRARMLRMDGRESTACTPLGSVGRDCLAAPTTRFQWPNISLGMAASMAARTMQILWTDTSTAHLATHIYGRTHP